MAIQCGCTSGASRKRVSDVRINGTYVGLGLWDSSDEVRKIKSFMRRKFSYARSLADTRVFDQEMVTAVVEMQRRYVESGALIPGRFISGVVNAETKYVMGFLKRPAKPRPIIFTVEGHMSNMWIGPCAAIGAQLEQEGLAVHQPIAYNRTALPFDNASGVREIQRLLNADRLDTGYPFPPELDWFLLGFSQGAIVTGRTWLDVIRPAKPGTRMAARKDHLKRAIAFGDPYREKDVIAEWVPDPPKRGTQGISDRRLDNTPDWWKVHSRHGDMYSENPDDEVGLNRTAIYKIAAENQWAGGPAGLLARMGDLVRDPMNGAYDIVKAIIGGVLFLGNMAPHGGYDLGPPMEYIRQGCRESMGL